MKLSSRKSLLRTLISVAFTATASIASAQTAAPPNASFADEFAAWQRLVSSNPAYRVAAPDVRQPAADPVPRPATLADARFLFRLRNDPVTRQSSFQAGRLRFSDHRAWLEARLSDPARRVRLWIALLVRPDGAALRIGQVRFDCDVRNRAEISIALAPRFRGRGHATPLLVRALAKAPAMRVLARIRVENEISQRAFAKAGFRRHGAVRPRPARHVVLLWRRGA